MKLAEQEPVLAESPSQDHSNRCRDDVILRRRGYKIAERKTGMEPVWIKDGQRYTQSAALANIFNGEGK